MAEPPARSERALSGFARLLELAVSALQASSARLSIGEIELCWPGHTVGAPSDWPGRSEIPGAVQRLEYAGPSGAVGVLEVVGVGVGPEHADRIMATVMTSIEDALDRDVEIEAAEEMSDHLYRNERMVAATSKELKESNAQLEQFAYIAAHELLHPLRAVAAFAELLPDLIKADRPKALEASLARIRDGTQAMQSQVGALLELASAEVDVETHEMVDANAVVHAAVDGLGEMLEEIGAVVVVDSLPLVRSSRVPLQAVFHNLISNAIRYRHPDRRLELSVKSHSFESGAVVEVHDNGIGISDGDLERIFGIFERAAADRSGSGIGLALVQRTLRRLGGSISVESEHGVGSCFRLTMPSFA